MRPDDLVYFKRWFREYVSGFCSISGDAEGPIRLKEEHTERTCRETVLLGRQLGLNESELLVAETAALFHDIGRFPQWRLYRTFIDSESEDHALLALKELSRHRVLQRLPAADAEVIRDTIRHHNRKELPTGLAPRSLFFARLLRDADKLDIWRVVIQRREPVNEVLGQALRGDMSTNTIYSSELVADLWQGRTPEFRQVRNKHDLQLLRIGWVFDLNFSPSCRQVLERRYVEQLFEYLPENNEIRELQRRLVSYLEDRLGENSP